MRLALTLLAVSLLTLSAQADWRQFRGNDGTGADSSCILPETWSADGENVAWKVELPGRGPSSPIVVDNRVIVTTADGADQEQLHVLCFSTEDGRLLWQRNFWATGRTFTHPQTTPAAPSPVSDGERIYAFFGSNDLACLDLQGNLVWYRGLGHERPKAGNDVGMASSPVVVDETLIVQAENQGDSFAAGFDAKTGEMRWSLPRPERANWASPIALTSTNPQGESIALLQSSSGVTAVAPKSGEVLWEIGGGASSISSSLAGRDRAYIASGGLTLLDLKNVREKPEVLWKASKLNPSSMSPILHEGKLYIINSAGVLNCADAQTGDPQWALRLKGKFWATPVIAGERMIAINYDGLALVIDLSGEKGEILHEIEMKENVQATPALDDDALYVKGERHLWKIGRSK